MKLPENYWDIIEKHLPNYSSRNDVAENNNLRKKIEDGNISDNDLILSYESSIKLYKEALSNIANNIIENINWEDWVKEDNQTDERFFTTNEVLKQRLEWLEYKLDKDEFSEDLETLKLLNMVLDLVDIDNLLKL